MRYSTYILGVFSTLVAATMMALGIEPIYAGTAGIVVGAIGYKIVEGSKQLAVATVFNQAKQNQYVQNILSSTAGQLLVNTFTNDNKETLETILKEGLRGAIEIVDGDQSENYDCSPEVMQCGNDYIPLLVSYINAPISDDQKNRIARHIAYSIAPKILSNSAAERVYTSGRQVLNDVQVITGGVSEVYNAGQKLITMFRY